MEMQRKMYVNTFLITINSKSDTVKGFTKYILNFDIDLDPETNDKVFDIFGQEVLSPSVDIVGPTILSLQFITNEEPLQKEGFTLLPIHFDCIKSMTLEYESKEDAGMYMWFGDKPIFKTVNKAYFILKKIDALRLTMAPDSIEELAMMIREPVRVVSYVLKQSGVSLNKLQYNNFRPKIKSNEFF